MVALNTQFQLETSPLTPSEMKTLTGKAFYVRLAGRLDALELDAFCIALDQDADYENENFEWFSQRCENFVYIDRIIVSRHAQGKGIARAIYRDLINFAKSRNRTMICCEVNSNPPNLASDRFHAALGFVELGEAILTGKNKTVKYLALKF